MTDSEENEELPKSVDEGVDRLLMILSDAEKDDLRSVKDPIELHFSLGMYIRNNFGLWGGNVELLRSCMDASGFEPINIDGKPLFLSFHPDSASEVIVAAVLKRLSETD